MSQLPIVSATDHAVDPVCGMTVDPARAVGPHRHNGHDYYFCRAECLSRFREDPERYLSGRREAHDQPPPGAAVRCVCPMHPEVVSDRPGPCPKCGMALEPEVASPDDKPDPELIDMSRRFLWGLILGGPVVVLAMLDMFAPAALPFGPRVNMLIQLALTTPVVLWCGWPFFVRAWHSFVNRSPNMFTLIALGVGAAYLYSVAAVLAPNWFPAGFHDEHGHVKMFF